MDKRVTTVTGGTDSNGLAPQVCPPCSPDGGYGHAKQGRTYRCPTCRTSWSPAAHLGRATPRFGSWIQRARVHLTS